MRSLVGAILGVLTLAVASPLAIGQAQASDRQHPTAVKHTQKKPQAPAPVSIRVSAGYDGQYRGTAWTPIRITLHNRTASDFSGTVEVPESTNAMNNYGPPQPFHALYQTPVTLPAGATKQVTLYIPGYDIQSEVDASLRIGGRTVSRATYITGFADNTFTMAALTSDPADVSWLNSLNPPGVTTNLVRLTPATLDPVPEALATFDLIALTDADTSRLDHEQIAALERYVHNGGSLLLIGGPNWQGTLRPLPADLLPGHLVGARAVPDLHSLLSISPVSTTTSSGRQFNQATTISVLDRPRGAVAASQAGVPLVVRTMLGRGEIEYLAFDPAVDPVRHWAGGQDLLGLLVTTAAPVAASRGAQPAGPPPSPFFNAFGPPSDIASELSNVPAVALPSLLLFIVLTALYILLLGPLNFLVLRRLKRRELTWVTVPTLALLCVGSTFGVAFHLKGSTVLLNTVGMVTLDGSDGPHPATLYVGLFAPVRGDYHLTYDGSALPDTVPQFNFYYGPGGPPPRTNPLGLRLQEGAKTGVTFLSMNMWSMRDVALHTTVNVPGTVQSNLHVDAHGDIVGTIHNGTNLTLRHPTLMAGRAVAHLHDIPAGATIEARVRPSADVYNQDQSPVSFRLYGRPQYGAGMVYGYSGKFPVALLGNGGFFYNGPCCGPPLPVEKSTSDRLRNVATMIPEAQSIGTLGEVVLVGWSEAPLGSLTVDGSTPQRRDLNLIAAPLSVRFPSSGSFRLRAGTLGAHLVDAVPQAPQNGCCGPPVQGIISLGAGGSATFQFDIPRGRSGPARFSHLTLWADAGGADGTNIGHVYDWQARRWVHVDLSLGEAELHNPNRFVSPSGALLLQLKATDTSGDIRIQNSLQDLQLSGSGSIA